MSIIANTSTGSKAPAVKFQSIGDAVAGRIVDIEDYQETVFGTVTAQNPQGEPKFYPSGDPVMGVRVTLETDPGNEGSRVTLWGQGKRLLQAISRAVKDSGASDLEIGGDLAVTFTGYDGRAKLYQAAYARPEVESE